MLRIGLTGGLASGKSFVGHELARLGCTLIQADELGHAVLLPDGEAYAGVIAEFGEGILDAGRTIDRHKLAAEVFGKPDRLAVLNELVHPPVVRREDRLAREAAAMDAHAIVVVEAAIMIEAGTYRRYDKIVVALCRREQQIERAMDRGLSREEVAARLESQLPLEEKRRFADYVIDTSGTKEATVEQVSELYRNLRSLEP